MPKTITDNFLQAFLNVSARKQLVSLVLGRQHDPYSWHNRRVVLLRAPFVVQESSRRCSETQVDISASVCLERTWILWQVPAGHRCLLAVSVSQEHPSQERACHTAAQGYSQLCLPLPCSCKPPLAHGCNFTTALPALTASPSIPGQGPHRRRPLQSCCQSAMYATLCNPKNALDNPKA